QTKVVDAQENSLVIAWTANLFEVQSYVSLTNHRWDGFWFLANRANWEALPENIRTVITKHINAAAVAERADIAAWNQTLEKDLTGKGMKFNKVDTTLFQDKLKTAGFYKDWKGKFGDAAWTALESAVGPLG